MEPASGAAIRRVEAEVGVVFGAQLATGLLVGVEPVEQALRIGRADLQAQQQPAELLDGGGIGLLIAQQVVEVEAPGHILDAHEDLALVDLERRQRLRPGFEQMIDRRGLATGARLARRASPQIASEDGLRQRLAAQRVMPGLTRLQLIAGGADAQLLARHHCRADHGDDGHHQQHGDQRHAALTTHCGSSPSNGSGTPSAPGNACCIVCSAASGRRSRRVMRP